MPSVAALEKELASELSGIEGGERQLCAGLQVRVAELATENRKLRRVMRALLDDKKTTYAVRANRARAALSQ